MRCCRRWAARPGSTARWISHAKACSMRSESNSSVRIARRSTRPRIGSSFAPAMARIGLECPRAALVRNLDQATSALSELGFPAVIRPSFTLGGTGGGIAYNREEFAEICERGLEASPTTEVLIEESVLGWKEFEMEVVRDRRDNCIIVCSIENLDPMGIHTGDSITVAPAQTLTDKEYQRMRNASIAVLREIGVDTGGSNVQFAIDPGDGRMVVIEMNPRVSRSSALASKATGFPIARVAAKLAVGYTLDELDNEITGRATPASFEPSIDYVVTKVPRFDFEKFPHADSRLTTQMKSVGEAMAVGRTFQESLQKALRSLETGLAGLDEIVADRSDHRALDDIRRELRNAGPQRLRYVADALRNGLSEDEVQRLSRIDPWFIAQIGGSRARGVRPRHPCARSARCRLDAPAQAQRLLRCANRGVARSGGECGPQPSHTPRPAPGVQADRFMCGGVSRRHRLHVLDLRGGVRGRADERAEDRRSSAAARTGSGRASSSTTAACRRRSRWREAGYESIMVNCNPETVSTDYDTSDRLYFEPLTLEDVLEIVRVEETRGRDRAVRPARPRSSLRGPWRRRACGSWEPARTASILRRIASGSSS